MAGEQYTKIVRSLTLLRQRQPWLFKVADRTLRGRQVRFYSPPMLFDPDMRIGPTPAKDIILPAAIAQFGDWRSLYDEVVDYLADDVDKRVVFELLIDRLGLCRREVAWLVPNGRLGFGIGIILWAMNRCEDAEITTLTKNSFVIETVDGETLGIRGSREITRDLKIPEADYREHYTKSRGMVYSSCPELRQLYMNMRRHSSDWGLPALQALIHTVRDYRTADRIVIELCNV